MSVWILVMFMLASYMLGRWLGRMRPTSWRDWTCMLYDYQVHGPTQINYLVNDLDAEALRVMRLAGKEYLACVRARGDHAHHSIAMMVDASVAVALVDEIERERSEAVQCGDS